MRMMMHLMLLLASQKRWLQDTKEKLILGYYGGKNENETAFKTVKNENKYMIVADTAPKMLCPDDFNLPYTLGVCRKNSKLF